MKYVQSMFRELTEAVGNCIPGNGSVVELSLVLDVEQQLLCHARTCCFVFVSWWHDVSRSKSLTSPSDQVATTLTTVLGDIVSARKVVRILTPVALRATRKPAGLLDATLRSGVLGRLAVGRLALALGGWFATSHVVALSWSVADPARLSRGQYGPVSKARRVS